MADSILTYKDRVIDERNSVQIKIDRLDTFTRSESFALVPIAEQDRMTRQLHIMRQYRDVLNERIGAFS